MSAFPPKADIGTQSRNVRFVPKDILHCGRDCYSITSSAPASSDLRNGQAEQFPISVILFDVMKSLLVLLIALLPLQAQAQVIQLTLNCQIERAHDFKTRQGGPSSGSFSAIVHMSNSQDATIEVTTGFCFNYMGSFSEQEVIGECKRTVGDSKYWAYLTINRINGEFEHVFTSSGGSAEIEYLEGHCTAG